MPLAHQPQPSVSLVPQATIFKSPANYVATALKSTQPTASNATPILAAHSASHPIQHYQESVNSSATPCTTFSVQIATLLIVSVVISSMNWIRTSRRIAYLVVPFLVAIIVPKDQYAHRV